MIDTDKLKALALAATPGKWEVDTIKSDGHYGTDEDGGYGYTAYVVTDEMGRPLMDSLNRDDSEIHEEYSDEEHYAWDELAKRDAAYIAAACPATVLELIAERDELRAEVERLREDAERLDYLDKYAVIAKPRQSIRDAIDDAINPAKEPSCGS